MDAAVSIILNLVISLTLIVGMFFMLAGGLGVVRLPDLFNRSHAASKCVTLGIVGLLISLVLHILVATTIPEGSATVDPGEQAVEQLGVEQPVTAAATKALLVVAFIFVAAPVGSHMLARAAHVAGVKKWDRTLSDELEEDRSHSDDEYPLYREPPDEV